jgi:hypothetical protein
LPTREDEIKRLRRLHDAYVWKVNAAVGAGRDDIVWRLVDDYLEEAMSVLSDSYLDACGRPGCGMCDRPRPGPRPVPARTWWDRLTGR